MFCMPSKLVPSNATPACPLSHLVLCPQVAKFAVPVYYGSRYQCEKIPQHQIVKAVQSKKVHISLTAEAKSSMSPAKKACVFH